MSHTRLESAVAIFLAALAVFNRLTLAQENERPLGTLGACCALYERPHPNNPQGPTVIVEGCENLTEEQCSAQKPITPNYPNGVPSMWLGDQLWTNEQGQCPRAACRDRSGDCFTPHPTFGCLDPWCCEKVCSYMFEGHYCCDIEWDEECVALASISKACTELPPLNDDCFGPIPGRGATTLPVPGVKEVSLTTATVSENDLRYCCHTGFAPTCVGGPLEGEACAADAECLDPEGIANGTCPPRQAAPAPGVGTVWFKFIASHSSVELSTCGSQPPATDSLIRVFAVLDRSDEQAACESLVPLACNDDTVGCSNAGGNSRTCVKNLRVGMTYYVMLSAKTLQAQQNATYRITAVAPCSTATGVMDGCLAMPVAACCALFERPHPVHEGEFLIVEDCENVNEAECNAQHPVTPQFPNGAPSDWQPGKLCGVGGQVCTRLACLTGIGGCFRPHNTPGCEDEACCSAVCNQWGELGSYCCEVEWDSTCIDLADFEPVCIEPEPTHDDCEAPRIISVPGVVEVQLHDKTNSGDDPEFCCHQGFPPQCIGGPNSNNLCENSGDCPEGFCPERVVAPYRGFGTVWYKFIATNTSVQLSTCGSNDPASDSLIQVFELTDSGVDICDGLVPIACNDDAQGCGDGSRNSRVCVGGLITGHTYYVLLAAKTLEAQHNAIYRLVALSPCDAGVVPTQLTAVHPPDQVVDARRPHSPQDSDQLLGVDRALVNGSLNLDSACFQLCESYSGLAPNFITVVDESNGGYLLKLDRPIHPGSRLAVYNIGHGGTRLTFTSHPGNVNADEYSDTEDVRSLLSRLRGQLVLPWGEFSEDIDHSGRLTPLDLLDLIDLLSGAEQYSAWRDTPRPTGNSICP